MFRRVASLTIFLSASGCFTPVTNEGDVLPPLPGTVVDAGGTPTIPGAPSTPGTPVAPGVPSTPGDGGALPADDGGVVVEGDGSVTGPVSIAGTGANCSTYGLPSGEQCGGIYCGVTLAQLEAAVVQPRIGRCTIVPPSIACEAVISRTVAKCARAEKQAKPWVSNAELRPDIQACVYREGIDMNVVVPDCLGCYLDSAQCSGDNCTIECLGGDSPDCDGCRARSGCNEGVAACTGFPDPR